MGSGPARREALLSWENKAEDMKVLLFQVDGKLPNLALMRLSAWHKAKGDEVLLLKSVRDLWYVNQPDVAYASSIFYESKLKREAFAARFGAAITGGDGYRPIWNDLAVIGRNLGSNLREVITDMNPDDIEPDYTLYPWFTGSIGYSQRGCRLDCGFCRMKTREGNARRVRTLTQLWRGDPHPRHLHLLDNDFFGQPQWREQLAEARSGGFKVSFTQGINIRLVNEEQARELSTVFYMDDQFKTRRLYTAWDNLGDERIFKKGVETLGAAGIPSKHLMVYMLIGFRKDETWEEIFHRFNEMVALGVHPYPMVFTGHGPRPDLKEFQSWVILRHYEYVPWDKYRDWKAGSFIQHKLNERQGEMFNGKNADMA